MSWFSEISERAENLLNSIDKNTAKALNKKSNLSSPTKNKLNYDQQDVEYETSISSHGTNANIQLNQFNYSNEEELGEINVTSSDYNNRNSTSFDDNVITKSSSNETKGDLYRNELLQNEIHSLNNEISVLLNRVKLAEQKCSDLQEQVISLEKKNVNLSEQISQLTHITETENEEKRSSLTLVPNSINRTTEDNQELNVHEHYDSKIQELLKEKSSTEDLLREKEDEILLLKSRLSQKTYCFSADELQSRLRVLTITLVDKQSALENAIADKSNVQNKLNQLQKKYDEALGILHQSRMNANHTDDVKARIPDVYKTKNFIDYYLNFLARSIASMVPNRKFVFRRISIFKLLTIIYVIFLHIFIVFYLYSNTPDNTSSQRPETIDETLP